MGTSTFLQSMCQAVNIFKRFEAKILKSAREQLHTSVFPTNPPQMIAFCDPFPSMARQRASQSYYLLAPFGGRECFFIITKWELTQLYSRCVKRSISFEELIDDQEAIKILQDFQRCTCNSTLGSSRHFLHK